MGFLWLPTYVSVPISALMVALTLADRTAVSKGLLAISCIFVTYVVAGVLTSQTGAGLCASPISSAAFR